MASDVQIVQDTYTFKRMGTCALQADVYRPAGEGLVPAILWLHGGALIFGDRRTLPAWQVTRYIEAGYGVVAMDYRLAPEVDLPAIVVDLRNGYDWLRQQAHVLGLDPTRVAVMGHSAGGYLTLLAGNHLQPRPQALVSFYGYGDITGAWYSQPDPYYCQQPIVPENEALAAVGARVLTGTPYGGELFQRRFRYYLYCRQQGLWPHQVARHDPDADAAWFAPYCPMHQIPDDYPPTLLIHGRQDTDVPVDQSEKMAAALDRQGIPHIFIDLPDRGHVFDLEPRALKDAIVGDVFARVLAFLARYVGAESV
jgi:acetyl esterase/lipase